MITRRNRLSKIEDALATRVHRYPRADVFPYPFADYLTLLVGEPCCITIGLGDADRLAFITNSRTPKVSASADAQWSRPSGDLLIRVWLLASKIASRRQKGIQKLLSHVCDGEGSGIVRYLEQCLMARGPNDRSDCSHHQERDALVLVTHERLLESLRSFLRLVKERYSSQELFAFSEYSLVHDVTVYVVTPGTSDLLVLGDSSLGQNPSSIPVEVSTAYRTGFVQWLSGGSGIAVPFHVHGAPWMVLAYKPSDGDTWWSCYSFYREFVPELGDALRTWVKTTLIDELTSILRSAIRPDSSESETENTLTTGFRILARCLPSPVICIPPIDSPDEIAKLDCGRAGVFLASIARRNEFHPKHLELFDSAAPDEVKHLLESMCRSIAAEEFQRSWTHASFTSHLLGTPIAELRGCLLHCKCDGVERARVILDEMDAYRKAIRSAVTKDTALEFTGSDEHLVDLVRQCFSDAQVHHTRCGKTVRSSFAYLKLVAGVCLDNLRQHGSGAPLSISMAARGDMIWVEIVNLFPRQKLQSVLDMLPDMNQGTTDQLGIQTLHLCADRWFLRAPEFKVEPGDGDKEPAFHVILPIAHYED